MEFLIWIQDSDFSTWIRESDWAIFAFLIIHTVGMAFVVGTSIAMDLRLLGLAPRIPIASLTRLAPTLLSGLISAIFSGVLLVIGYPAKAITNPLFYWKLALITIGLLLTRNLFAQIKLDSTAVSRRSKSLALLCILLWICALTAGKFLAYTNKVLLVY